MSNLKVNLMSCVSGRLILVSVFCNTTQDKEVCGWSLTEFIMVCLTGRSLIQSMVLDGSVWWDQVLGVFSPIPREHSSTLLWRLSISSSSKGLLILSNRYRVSPGYVWL